MAYGVFRRPFYGRRRLNAVATLSAPAVAAAQSLPLARFRPPYSVYRRPYFHIVRRRHVVGLPTGIIPSFPFPRRKPPYSVYLPKPRPFFRPRRIILPNADAVGVVWVAGNIIREIDPADTPDASFFFEAILAAPSGGTARARLFNITTGTEVANSEVTTSNANSTRLRSAVLTLASGPNDYRAEYGGVSGDTHTVFAADVVVISA